VGREKIRGGSGTDLHSQIDLPAVGSGDRARRSRDGHSPSLRSFVRALAALPVNAGPSSCRIMHDRDAGRFSGLTAWPMTLSYIPTRVLSSIIPTQIFRRPDKLQIFSPTY
jgi:hypothetical protein